MIRNLILLVCLFALVFAQTSKKPDLPPLPTGFVCENPNAPASAAEIEPIYFIVPPVSQDAVSCLAAYNDNRPVGAGASIWVNAEPKRADICKGKDPGTNIHICTLTEAQVDKLAADLKVDEYHIPESALGQIKVIHEADFVKVCFVCQ